MAQMPKINDLEKALEVQDEDAELVAIKKQMEKSISETEKKLKDGNAKIAEKLGNTPDSAK